MFFILSKTAGLLLLPSNLLVTFVFLGLVLMTTRFRRAGQRLAIGCLIVLALSSFLPLGAVLSHKLETRFPPWDPIARGAPDGIVVLGGAIDAELSYHYGHAVVGNAAERVIALAQLARVYPNARIVYSGGDASFSGSGEAEADFIHPLLDSLGIPRSRIVLETRSRNTAENALFSKRLMQPKPGERWLLVTSAQHMPRAVGCFRQVAFDVEAYPVDWRTAQNRIFQLPLKISLAERLAAFDDAAHEWIGLVAYWIFGRTSELLPSPA
jgi:uncharacterized SAM-binding protein YcdF (DUF218 family)